jgi:RNA polymerase sigma-32 factor
MKPNFGTLSPKEVKEVARVLNVKETDVTEMEKRLSGQEISLEPANDDEESNWVSPIAYLQDATVDPSEQLVVMQKQTAATEGMLAALESLDDRSRRIIETRWLNEGEEKTLHELADEFGVSAERIRQIETKAMQKMKLALKDYDTLR